MDILSSLAVVILAALIHSSFQLSVSVLTLLSGRAMGSRKSNNRVLQLTTSFVSGAAFITLLLLSTIALVIGQLTSNDPPQIVWAIACGLMVGVGLAVWIFYYRSGPGNREGTSLWIPRYFADFLATRTKLTKSSPEAFSLGVATVISELLFIIAPLFIAALALVRLDPTWQLPGIALYALISLMSLMIAWGLIGSGHSLSSIQRWREANKRFLQFSAGAGLFILAIFTYVYEIMGSYAS